MCAAAATAPTSAPELLTLHAVRLLGAPTTQQIADLYRLAHAEVTERVLDAQAFGWVSSHSFDHRTRWSITERGRAENERLLAAELGAAGARPAVEHAYRLFLPLNARLSEACTRWQVRPTAWDAMALNDHTDPQWDDRVVESLVAIERQLRPLAEEASAALPRLGVHAPRFRAALVRVQRGERTWVDAPERASCHLVWIQLHEDLLATLGLSRASEG